MLADRRGFALDIVARPHAGFPAFILYIGAVMDVDRRGTNRYFANAEPWKLAKTDPERMRNVLYVTLETLRNAGAILLQPVMPSVDGQASGSSGPRCIRANLLQPLAERDFALIAANRLTPGTLRCRRRPAIFPRYAARA